MIEREQIIYDKYEAQGYDIIKAGAPDLILLKDGVISFIEVKSETDKLSESQERAFRLLRKHGFDAKVETVNILSTQINAIEINQVQNLRRIVVPSQMMQSLGWELGDKVLLEVDDGKLFISAKRGEI